MLVENWSVLNCQRCNDAQPVTKAKSKRCSQSGRAVRRCARTPPGATRAAPLLLRLSARGSSRQLAAGARRPFRGAGKERRPCAGTGKVRRAAEVKQFFFQGGNLRLTPFPAARPNDRFTDRRAALAAPAGAGREGPGRPPGRATAVGTGLPGGGAAGDKGRGEENEGRRTRREIGREGAPATLPERSGGSGAARSRAGAGRRGRAAGRGRAGAGRRGAGRGAERPLGAGPAVPRSLPRRPPRPEPRSAPLRPALPQPSKCLLLPPARLPEPGAGSRTGRVCLPPIVRCARGWGEGEPGEMGGAGRLGGGSPRWAPAGGGPLLCGWRGPGRRELGATGAARSPQVFLLAVILSAASTRWSEGFISVSFFLTAWCTSRLSPSLNGRARIPFALGSRGHAERRAVRTGGVRPHCWLGVSAHADTRERPFAFRVHVRIPAASFAARTKEGFSAAPDSGDSKDVCCKNRYNSCPWTARVHRVMPAVHRGPGALLCFALLRPGRSAPRAPRADSEFGFRGRTRGALCAPAKRHEISVGRKARSVHQTEHKLRAGIKRLRCQSSA